MACACPGGWRPNFLAGHRARYVPPLRLFLVLSVLIFFVGKPTLHWRVHGQGWSATLAKYTILDGVCTVRLCFVLVYAVLAGMSS